MTVFRGKDWVLKAKIQLQNLTAKVKKPRIQTETISRLIRWASAHKATFAKSLGACALLVGISAGGNHYVSTHMHEVYYVYIGDEEIGIVSDPAIIDETIREIHTQAQLVNPDVHIELDTSGIDVVSDRAFRADYNDELVQQRLGAKLEPHAIGVKLMVDGQVVAVLRDQEEANSILDQIKEQYVDPKEEKQQRDVAILAANGDADSGTKVLASVEFTKDVELVEDVIDPDDLADTDRVVSTLTELGEAPQIYVVEKGDCMSCVAAKFDMKRADLELLNPWVVDDRLDIGDQLVVKGFEPSLGVKTIEIVVDEEEVQFETIYQQDNTLRMGKNGLKKVTYELVSINGKLMTEELLHEEVIMPAESAVVARGTLRLAGEGTGKFSWPVSGAKVTSSYGSRWGSMHSGMDMVSSNRTIKAADTGKVTFAGKRSGYGNLIIIDHSNGYVTYYAHLKSFDVKKGEVVEKGDAIGVMGNTGRSTGVHLHFEVHVNGKAQNPSKYLSK